MAVFITHAARPPLKVLGHWQQDWQTRGRQQQAAGELGSSRPAEKLGRVSLQFLTNDTKSLRRQRQGRLPPY